MREFLWQLDRHGPRLQCGGLRGAIDLGRPDRGLGGLATELGPLDDAQLLGLEVPSCEADRAASPGEAYVRGGDLVATYGQAERWPVAVDVVWRALAPSGPDAPAGAVELLVSVRTERLESRPALSACSVVPAREVLRLSGGATPRLEPAADGRETFPRADGRLPCLVFRLPQAGLSYVEMVHPADAVEDGLQGASAGGGRVRVAHRLFAGPLEKGVIRRARIRGVFVPRDRDERIAAECFAAFARSEPPLEA